jgi:transposase-like protein
MRKYNVAEIANLFNINEETVRRWIRFEGLMSSMESKKTGNVVDERDLFTFIERSKPKYFKMLVRHESQIDDTYFGKLKFLLDDLINERDRLNDRIDKIQKLLKES